MNNNDNILEISAASSTVNKRGVSALNPIPYFYQKFISGCNFFSDTRVSKRNKNQNLRTKNINSRKTKTKGILLNLLIAVELIVIIAASAFLYVVGMLLFCVSSI